MRLVPMAVSKPVTEIDYQCKACGTRFKVGSQVKDKDIHCPNCASRKITKTEFH